MADTQLRDCLCRPHVCAGRLTQADEQCTDRWMGALAAAAGFAGVRVAQVRI